MQCPKAAIFDLDDTLAESFMPPKADMLARLARLLIGMPVAIMTAAGMPRIEGEILDQLALSPHVDQLYIFPNSAAQCYVHEGGWRLAYSEALNEGERQKIKQAIIESITETHMEQPHPSYEPKLIDREAQIAYAFLGLEATTDDKAKWDPDQSKRQVVKAALEKRIPEFEILIGGKTTIDITKKGVNKSYGVHWLSQKLAIPTSEMVYVGDALYPGGNDYVVVETGVQARITSGPQETLTIIDEILSSCSL